MDLGVTLIDMGGGTTTIAVFYDGNVIYTDSVPVGGEHVTRDIARGLSTSRPHAERMKTLYGACVATPYDDHELIDVPLIGEDNARPSQPRAALDAGRHHRAAARGDLRAGAQPAGRLRRGAARGPAPGADRRRLAAPRRARARRPHPRQAGAHRPAACASPGSPIRPPARPSRPRPGCSPTPCASTASDEERGAQASRRRRSRAWRASATGYARTFEPIRSDPSGGD